MSLPRAVVAGRCCLITRRCSERRFFLKPSPRTEAFTRNKQFLETYKTAVGRYRQGEEAVFTPGTKHMVRFHITTLASA